MTGNQLSISPRDLHARLGTASAPLVIDVPRPADLARADWLVASALRLRSNFPDDHAVLRHGVVIDDALYTWWRALQAETHNWPSTRPVQQAAR
jgi:hypothetical protein